MIRQLDRTRALISRNRPNGLPASLRHDHMRRRAGADPLRPWQNSSKRAQLVGLQGLWRDRGCGFATYFVQESCSRRT